MSKGKPSRIARHVKAAMQWLDYVASKPTLWAMSARPARARTAPDCGLGPEDLSAIRKALKPKAPKRKRKRLTVAERIRFKYWLFWKYGPECAYCHRFYDWRDGLTIDHIQPVSKGGALRDVRNMVLACKGCNRDKGDKWEDLNTR